MRSSAERLAALSLLIAYSALLAWLSLRTGGNPGGFDGADKLYHALAYGMLMALLGWVLRLQRLMVGFLAACAFGVAMELAQGWLTEMREPSLADALANAAGALAVWAGLEAWRRWRG